MEYLIGILSAAAIAVFARSMGFEKDRSFYPTVLIVIGFLYVLFGAIDGRLSVLLVEGSSALVFSGLAVAGYRKGCRIVAFGIAAHGVFDFLHPFLVNDTGVPVWWPGFCGSIDIALGLYIAIFVCRKLPGAAN